MKNQKVYLKSKYILADGCDVEACTDIVHADNADLFRRIAQIMDADIIGIDFIIPDISKSFSNQDCGVIETNSVPYLDMHQFPSSGSPDNVAKVSVDFLKDKLQN